MALRAGFSMPDRLTMQKSYLAWDASGSMQRLILFYYQSISKHAAVDLG